MTFAAFLLIYGTARIAEMIMRSVSDADSLPTAFAAFFLLAPAAGLASFLHSQYRLTKAEPGHSTALAHFIRRDYDLARKDTDRILDGQPEDIDALMLAVHIRLRQDRASEIEPLCRRIDELVPNLGADILERAKNVWVNSSVAPKGIT